MDTETDPMTLAAARPPVYAVRAVERTLDIIDTLARSSEGLPLSAIAKDVSMPRSSVFRYLAVLESRRYVSRDAVTGNYRLGLVFFSFASPPLRSLGATARPLLERLRDMFDETINLGVLDGTRVLYVEVVESMRAMRLSARRGDRDFIHSTSLGKAIAAQLSSQAVAMILELEGMPRLTSKTLTDLETYLRALEDVRETGFSTDMGESEEGAYCVAVALDWPASNVHAAISLSSPAARFPMDDLQRVVTELRATAHDISAAIRAAD